MKKKVSYTLLVMITSCHVDDLNTRNKCLPAKLLKQGYRYKVKKGVF